MATIEKRQNDDGTVSYRVKVRLKGQPTASATFERLTDAKRWAAETETKIRAGRYFAQAEGKRHTLAEAIARYRVEYLPSLAQSRDRARQLTWWENRLGAFTLADITPRVINEQLQALAAEPTPKGTTKAPATIQHYRVAIAHLLNVAAKDWEWLAESPAPKIKRIKVENERDRFLSDNELKRLLEAVAPHEDLSLFVYLALSTGARAGELLGLEWSQVDIKRRTITLRAGETKNKDARVLPIVEPALSMLRQRVRRLDSPLVFPGHRHPSRPINLRKPWEQALARAGIENFKIHDMRHSAASWLAQQGVSMVAIAALLGHRTLQMTKRYSHLANEHLQEVATKLGDKLAGGAA